MIELLYQRITDGILKLLFLLHHTNFKKNKNMLFADNITETQTKIMNQL